MNKKTSWNIWAVKKQILEIPSSWQEWKFADLILYISFSDPSNESSYFLSPAGILKKNDYCDFCSPEISKK